MPRRDPATTTTSASAAGGTPNPKAQKKYSTPKKAEPNSANAASASSPEPQPKPPVLAPQSSNINGSGQVKRSESNVSPSKRRAMAPGSFHHSHTHHNDNKSGIYEKEVNGSHTYPMPPTRRLLPRTADADSAAVSASSTSRSPSGLKKSPIVRRADYTDSRASTTAVAVAGPVASTTAMTKKPVTEVKGTPAPVSGAGGAAPTSSFPFSAPTDEGLSSVLLPNTNARTPCLDEEQNISVPFAVHPPSHSVANYAFRTTQRQRDTYAALDALMAAPLPELQQPTVIPSYEEASLEKTLYRIVESNDIIIVAGSFFGDEGKGKTVDAVAHHPLCTTIARTNSGENAGHTVFDRLGRKFVFNLAPSGLLTPGKKNYIGPESVMDPVSFIEKEVKQLVDAGIKYHDTLFVGNTCIVTPYHKLLDLLGSAVNASTLKGMAPVHASKVTKRGIRLDHIFNDEETLRTRLSKDMETYEGLLKVMGLSDDDVVARCQKENSDGVIRVPDYVVDFARAADKVSFLVDLYRTRVRENPAFPTRCDVIHELRAAVLRGEKVLLEGPQSYWLSNAREKFWGSTTSADTTAAGLLAASQINFQRLRAAVINVHKAPASSRVGLGACPCNFVPQDFFSAQGVKTLNDLPAGMCADFDAIQKLYFSSAFVNAGNAKKYKGLVKPVEYTDATGTYNIGVAMAVASVVHHGECGAVTKKPRICGLFDCVLQSEVGAVQGPYLSISALDRGDEYEKLGITIAYLYYSPEGVEVDVNGKKYKNGDIIRAGDPVPGEAALYHCHPIVKLVNGWKQSPISSKTRAANAPLPKGVCEFIATVEHFCQCKVLSIGNGPSGADIIYLKQRSPVQKKKSLKHK